MSPSKEAQRRGRGMVAVSLKRFGFTYKQIGVELGVSAG